jgi:hypothetical protein
MPTVSVSQITVDQVDQVDVIRAADGIVREVRVAIVSPLGETGEVVFRDAGARALLALLRPQLR